MNNYCTVGWGLIFFPRIISLTTNHPYPGDLAAEVEVDMENPEEVFQLPRGAIELGDAAAFENVADNKGLISICGFGSLLSGTTTEPFFLFRLNFGMLIFLNGLKQVMVLTQCTGNDLWETHRKS